MKLSGSRVRRILLRRQQNDASESRLLHDDERTDSLLDLESDFNESLTSDDDDDDNDLFDTTGLLIHVYYIVRLLN